MLFPTDDGGAVDYIGDPWGVVSILSVGVVGMILARTGMVSNGGSAASVMARALAQVATGEREKSSADFINSSIFGLFELW